MNDWIELSGCRFDTIIGILDWERDTPQAMQVALRMQVDLERAALTGDVRDTVDYAAVLSQVTWLAQAGEFLLLESLGLAVARLLLLPPGALESRCSIDAIDLRLLKPDVLGGRGVPGIRLLKEASWCALPAVELQPGVQAVELVLTPRVLVQRVHLDEGTTWSAGRGTAIYVLGGSLHTSEDRLSAGQHGAGEPCVAVGGAVSLIGVTPVSRPQSSTA